MDEMSPATDNSALVKAAEDFLAAAKSFKGDPGARTNLMWKANNCRFFAEDAGGTMFRQWDTVDAKFIAMDLRAENRPDAPHSCTRYLVQVWRSRDDSQKRSYRAKGAS